jgi:hypothetical protein
MFLTWFSEQSGEMRFVHARYQRSVPSGVSGLANWLFPDETAFIGHQ